MRNITAISFLIIFFLITSCTKESKVKSKVNEYVEKNFNDPSSYELIELQLIDTLKEGKAAKFLIDKRVKYIAQIENYIKEQKEENGRKALNAFFSGNHFRVLIANNELKKQELILNSYKKDSIGIAQKEIEKLKKYSLSKNIIYYRYRHEFRAKNDVGALVKITDTIRIDDGYTIILEPNRFIAQKFGVRMSGK